MKWWLNNEEAHELTTEMSSKEAQWLRELVADCGGVHEAAMHLSMAVGMAPPAACRAWIQRAMSEAQEVGR